MTKRLHNRLHGVPDGLALGLQERAVYLATLQRALHEIEALVAPGDVVLLHDPQTAGMVPLLARTGARILWRSHVGHDHSNEQTQQGWDFLRSYLEEARGASFFSPRIRPVLPGESPASNHSSGD